MVISAGVFVSCEDYDDDISNLQTQINDLGSTLTALQSQVQAGKWITSVSSTTEGLTIVFSDGTQYTITNGKDGAPGTPGGSGNGTLVEVKDGYWYLNGEKTDYLALTKEDKVPVPYVNEEDGYWYFYNEEGEAVKSDYKALGATYAVKDANTGVWTLHVPDADGTMQSIDLPTAAAKITGLTFTSADNELALYKTTWKLTPSTTKWAGPKTLPKDGSFIYGSTDQLEIQVSPADVAKDIENYTLINSKNVTVGLALTAEPYNDLLGVNGDRVTKATTNGNGLYTITVEPQVISENDQTALAKLVDALIQEGGAAVGYALVADNVFRSAYEVTITNSKEDAPKLTTLSVKDIKDDIAIGTEATANNLKSNPIKVGTTYTVTFKNPAAVYDSYFEFLDTDISTFGITYDNESKTFTVGKNPDVASLTGQFVMTVYTVDINGNVQKTEITFHLAAEMANNMLAAQTVDVSKDKPAFQYNLSDVAITGTDQWKQNVDLTAEYALYTDEKCTKPVTTDPFTTNLFAPTVANAQGKAAANADEATKVVFTIDNSNNTAGLELNTTYYLKTTFKTKGGEVLNTVILPVMFTAPALEDLFATKEGYVKDGVINAYFNNTIDDDNTNDNTDVSLKEYFSETVDGLSSLTLDGNTNIVKDADGKDYKSDGLATLTSATTSIDDATLTLKTAVYKPEPNDQYELGYGEALIVTAKKDNYKGWKYKAKSGDDTYSFKIRLMSPIMEGSIKAVGDVITLPANDVVNGAKITDAMIKGYDYNNNEYNIVPDKHNTAGTTDWKRPEIKSIKLTKDATNYLESFKVVDASDDGKGNTVNGYFEVKAKSLSSTIEITVTVAITDIWDYTKESEVKVRITVGE